MSPISTLQFRRATEADIPAMSAIRLSVRENVLSDPSRVTLAMYRDYLEQDGRGWVCEDQDQIIGFAYAARKDHSIWALFVAPEHEAKGAGKQLLKLACEWLFSQGALQIQLDTKAGTRADRFYATQKWQRTATADSLNVKFTLAKTQDENR